MELLALMTLVAAFLVLFSSPARAEELSGSEEDPPFALPEGVRLAENLVYGRGGGRHLKLDLFLPEGGGSGRPGIAFAHGGGWRGGTRKQFWRQAAHMATKGFVGACIEYRFSGEAAFPAAVEDAKCAVRWMRACSERHGIDPERIGAVGGSAGGHLVAMLGTTQGMPQLEGEGGQAEHSSAVKAVVPFNGVFDLVALGKSPTQAARGPLAEFLGGNYDEVPETYELASPIAHADGGDAAFLMLHGAADETIPFDQSAAFQKRLQEAGVHAELEAYEDAEHGFFNRSPHFGPTLKAMAAFLIEQLGT